MRKPRVFESWQKEFIASNSLNMTKTAMAKKLSIPISTLHTYMDNNNIPGKLAHEKTRQRLQVTNPKKLKRPPCLYTQIPSPYGIADQLLNRQIIKK